MGTPEVRQMKLTPSREIALFRLQINEFLVFFLDVLFIKKNENSEERIEKNIFKLVLFISKEHPIENNYQELYSI